MELSDPPLAVFGDWHGHLGWALGAIDAAERAGVRTLLHVGDFGLDFPGPQRSRYESKLSRRLAASNLQILVSPGNHDNWSTIQKLPVLEDGTAQFTEQIRILPRGSRTTVHGLVIGALGGRLQRRPRLAQSRKKLVAQGGTHAGGSRASHRRRARRCLARPRCTGLRSYEGRIRPAPAHCGAS
ncbi:metallophosphoesterase family protein [Arthrobacter sp. H41]|uniref:metallophosphoesterase family protein n=1 Tax=Arthrobacter sp. H41 TaxID=1312978 RepID=UPI0012DD25DF